MTGVDLNRKSHLPAKDSQPCQWLELRRFRFQAHRLRLVRRAERKQDEDEDETDGSLREYRAWRPGVCSAAEGEELRPATVGQVFSSTRCFW